MYDGNLKSSFASNNILHPSLDYLGDTIRNFNGSCLNQGKITYAHKTIVLSDK